MISPYSHMNYFVELVFVVEVEAVLPPLPFKERRDIKEDAKVFPLEGGLLTMLEA